MSGTEQCNSETNHTDIEGEEGDLTRALSEVSVEVISQLKERARLLGLEEDSAKYANRVQTAETEIGDYNLILGGLSEF